MNDVSDLGDTIKPKSDQLNADDLVTGAITVTIKGVSRGSADQPVSIDIDGYMPYKPCKSMRRVMVNIWGVNGAEWVGKSITLFNDPSVKFGGVALGGIRISHASHITQPVTMMLTTTRSKRSAYTIEPLAVADYSAIIQQYRSTPDGDAKVALWNTMSIEQQSAVTAAFS